MSALEALKLIAPTAHLERRGGVEGGAEGSGAVVRASLRSSAAANAARRARPAIYSRCGLKCFLTWLASRVYIAHRPRPAPTRLLHALTGITTRSQCPVPKSGSMATSPFARICVATPSSISEYAAYHKGATLAYQSLFCLRIARLSKLSQTLSTSRIFLALALQYPKGVPAARLVEPPSRLVGRWLGAPGTRPKFQRRTPPQPPWPPQPARPRPPPRLPRPRPPRPVGAAVAQG